MRPALPRLLLLLLLLALLSRSRAMSGEAPETVPLPMNVLIKSLNFNTTLHWDYMSMPLTPLFNVEIKPYELGKFKPVRSCTNISKHDCNLSNEIEEVDHSYWARVKAFVELKESEYVETKEFVLRRDGKIGPPTLTMSIEGDEIRVDIHHLWRFPSAVKNHYKAFKYKVFLQSNENLIQELQTEQCKRRKCSVYIPISSTTSTYCVSAQGTLPSIFSGRMFSKSNESCIHVPFKQPLDLRSTITGVAVVFAVGLILTVLCLYKQLKKKIELPKSLVSVVRNLNSRNILETKPEAKYISVITSSSSQPVSVIDEVNFIEQVDPDKEIGTPNPEDCSEKTDTISSQEISNETEEMSIQESTAEMIPDDEQSPRVKENYFHSNGSQTELCSIPSNPEPSNTKMQQSMVLRSCNSGYDKPHVPLNLLIDVGEEESVIAYKHTDKLQG